MNISKSVKKLAIRDCANYDKVFNDIKDYCCLEWTKDYRCLFFIKENAKCDYFERAVLPMNPQLEALYRAEHQAKIVNYELTKEDKKRIIEEKTPVAGKIKIHCKKCKQVFLADHYNQQYCKFCKSYIRRESTRKAMSRKRDVNVSNVLSKNVDT